MLQQTKENMINIRVESIHSTHSEESFKAKRLRSESPAKQIGSVSYYVHKVRSG